MSASEQAEQAHLESGARQLAAECERLREVASAARALLLCGYEFDWQIGLDEYAEGLHGALDRAGPEWELPKSERLTAEDERLRAHPLFAAADRVREAQATFDEAQRLYLLAPGGTVAERECCEEYRMAAGALSAADNALLDLARGALEGVK